MRTKKIAGVVVLIALFTSCSSRGTGDTAGRHTSTTATVASLASKLLTADDVGPEWQAGSAVNSADFADATQLPCGGEIDAAVVKRLTPVVGVQFEPKDRSYQHIIEFAVTGEHAQLADDLRTFFRAVAKLEAS